MLLIAFLICMFFFPSWQEKVDIGFHFDPSASHWHEASGGVLQGSVQLTFVDLTRYANLVGVQYRFAVNSKQEGLPLYRGDSNVIQ